MSDYRFEFGASTNKIGSEVSEVFDLVDDLGFTEEELEGKSEDEIQDLLEPDAQEFIANNVDCWVTRV